MSVENPYHSEWGGVEGYNTVLYDNYQRLANVVYNGKNVVAAYLHPIDDTSFAVEHISFPWWWGIRESWVTQHKTVLEIARQLAYVHSSEELIIFDRNPTNILVDIRNGEPNRIVQVDLEAIYDPNIGYRSTDKLKRWKEKMTPHLLDNARITAKDLTRWYEIMLDDVDDVGQKYIKMIQNRFEKYKDSGGDGIYKLIDELEEISEMPDFSEDK